MYSGLRPQIAFSIIFQKRLGRNQIRRATAVRLPVELHRNDASGFGGDGKGEKRENGRRVGEKTEPSIQAPT